MIQKKCLSSGSPKLTIQNITTEQIIIIVKIPQKFNKR